MKYAIRPADKSHAELLANIHRRCFPHYWDINAFNDFFAIEGTHALLAESEQPVGMMVYRIAGDQADIMTIAVLPEHRRQGLAAALVEKALADIATHKIDTLFLDVEDGNVAAIALYEKYGFSHLRRRKLYYRQKDGTCTDALVMQRKL